MKLKLIIGFALASFFIVSCAPIVENTPIKISTAIPTATLTVVPPTITPAPTATIKIERWMEYENALAKVILPISSGICEWEILGQKNQEVYVWAICQVTNNSLDSAASLPAVILLGSDGGIEKVQIPGDGTHYAIDIRKMFPKELQDKIFNQSVDTGKMWSHIKLRQKNPEPPLIVASGVILP
jgi:hypothetical protein